MFLNTSAVSPLSSANLAFTCRTFCGFSENIHGYFTLVYTGIQISWKQLRFVYNILTPYFELVHQLFPETNYSHCPVIII
jgi:hypothetical protein